MTTPPIAGLATLACLLEAGVAKPGNVSPGRPFRDMRFEDFAASAVAIGPELALAGERPLGETILAAVRATRRWVAANTNLGIVLLLAPLARAVARGTAGLGKLRAAVGAMLEETTVEDARLAYQAIREANPGGLGRVSSEDVATEPTVPLREAMSLAAARDSVAREWVTDFRLTFQVGAPAMRAALAAGMSREEATLEGYLALLAAEPDTLIARKLGREAARDVSREAAAIVAAGGGRTAAGRAQIAAFDQRLRDPHNSRNPGTTADLTAAALFVVLAEDAGAADPPRTSRAQ
jgi:triphosphoribosyl-dephospho-CoA synthase